MRKGDVLSESKVLVILYSELPHVTLKFHSSKNADG